MVGAKQFAIMRKIIEDKKENPIVKNIAMPPWLKGEKELRSLSGNFLDRFKPSSRILDEPKKIVAPQKIKDVKEINHTKEATPEKEEFSEELINKLTYQVFQNIKSYLDDTPENPVGSKHIKLEISL